ncbi:MAG: T9SS type A sorting domain-containing protein [Bacteroidia bacterium]|nr:T9SS type A sorting domain-containing protein [Bacteroidia bacterium]
MYRINRYAYLLAFTALALFALRGNAQIPFLTPLGSTIVATSDRGAVCGSTQGYLTAPFIYDNGAGINTAFSTIPANNYFKARAGEPITITLNVTSPSLIGAITMTGLIGTDSPPYLYDQDNVPVTGLLTTPSSMTFTATFTFGRADTRGWIVFSMLEYGPALQTFSHNQIILPFVIEGVLNPEVPILGTTTVPQIPFMILHAPPGDGSSSKFLAGKTVCRSYEDSYVEDASNNVNASVKLGVKGSIGIIVQTDYEAYVQFNTSGTIGAMQMKTTSDETCVTVNSEFATTELAGANGSGDVFIGYGRDLYYGKYKYVAVENCAAIVDSGLVFTPVPNSERTFVYTADAIQTEIENLTVIMNDASNNPRLRNQAQNQIDVWNQILQLNEANKNNPGNELIEQFNFSAGTSQTHSKSITTTQVTTITAEQYFDVSAGIEGLVEIGGSGFSGGYEYTTSKRFGSTQSASEETSKLLEYTLTDDDAGDLFKVDVVRDPMYGTPVFRMGPGAKSSCPYQGGYQRDQPNLKHDNQSSSSITILGAPVNGAATFKLDLCNDSNEPRTYNLKLNALSNLNGAIVKAAGVPLNGNDLGQEFTVPASSCVEDLIVTVSMDNISSPQAYPNLEIFLYAPCESDIKSSVFASVYFGNTLGVQDLENLSGLTLYPNPASGLLTADFTLAEGSEVQTGLYDLAGRLRLAGTDSYLPAGEHQARFDVQQLPAGLYLLRIETETGITTGRVMVAR